MGKSWMIYLLISNRPEFIPFAIKQFEKCSYANLVILGNGGGFKDFKTDHEFYYKPEWRYNSDCFNWFQENCQCNEDLFLMDDDIYIHSDLTVECKKYLTLGFDKVVYTEAYLYDTQENKTARTNWQARKVGGAWGMNKDLWRHSKWPDWPMDAMLGWFKRLPEHNIKMIPRAEITHLIHGKNVVLRALDKYNWTDENNQDLIKEYNEYNT